MGGCSSQSVTRSLVIALVAVLVACSGGSGGGEKASPKTSPPSSSTPPPTIDLSKPIPGGSLHGTPRPPLENTGTDYVAIFRSLDANLRWLSENPDPSVLRELFVPGTAGHDSARCRLTRYLTSTVTSSPDEGYELISAEVVSVQPDAVSLRVVQRLDFERVVDGNGQQLGISDSSGQPKRPNVVLSASDGRWRFPVGPRQTRRFSCEACAYSSRRGCAHAAGADGASAGRARCLGSSRPGGGVGGDVLGRSGRPRADGGAGTVSAGDPNGPAPYKYTWVPGGVFGGRGPSCDAGFGQPGWLHTLVVTDLSGAIVSQEVQCLALNPDGSLPAPPALPPVPSIGEIWRAALRQIPPPKIGINPRPTGLTGLETWLWYEGPEELQVTTSIGPWTVTGTRASRTSSSRWGRAAPPEPTAPAPHPTRPRATCTRRKANTASSPPPGGAPTSSSPAPVSHLARRPWASPSSARARTTRSRKSAACSSPSADAHVATPARHNGVVHAAAVCFDLHVPESRSLKAKRGAVRPIVDGIRHKYRLSVAEVDHQDQWQRAAIAVAVVAESDGRLRRVLEQVERYVAGAPDVELLDVSTAYLEPEDG